MGERGPDAQTRGAGVGTLLGIPLEVAEVGGRGGAEDSVRTWDLQSGVHIRAEEAPMRTVVHLGCIGCGCSNSKTNKQIGKEVE